MRSILGLVCIIGLAACGPKPQPKTPEPPPAPQPSVEAPADPIDPFLLAIEAGRWQVLMDHAAQGAMAAPDPVSQAAEEPDALRIDRSLKQGAASLLTLRDIVCAKELVPHEKCVFQDWPSWTAEPFTAATPIETLQVRSDWLGETMQDIVAAGCEAGKTSTQDELFCSVE